jgi:hypothetical protein
MLSILIKSGCWHSSLLVSLAEPVIYPICLFVLNYMFFQSNVHIIYSFLASATSLCCSFAVVMVRGQRKRTVCEIILLGIG